MLEVIIRLLSALRPRAWRLQDFDVAFSILRRIRPNENVNSDVASVQRDTLPNQLLVLARFIKQKQLFDGDLRTENKCIDILRQAVGDLESGKPIPSITPKLDQIEAMLDVARMIAVGNAENSRTRVPVSTKNAPSNTAEAPPNQHQDSDTSPNIPPSEIAFLWNSSEKLYSSWPFRFLGMLMLAAVLLAGAGTFFIGGQTLQLRQNLENTARTATADLQAFGNETHKTLTEQRQGLLGDIDRRRDEIKEAMAKADQQIKDLDQLKEQAIARIVQTVLANSTDLEARLHSEIASNLAKIKDNDVQDLQSKVDALQLSIRQLAAGIDDEDKQLKSSQPDLQRIVQLTQDADKLETALGEIRQAHKAAVEASELSVTARISAQAAAAETMRTQQDLSEKTKPISNDIGTVQRNLGVAQERLNRLVSDIDQASNSVGKITKSVSGFDERLKALDQRFAEIEDAMEKLRSHAQQPQPIPAPSTPAFVEANLTGDQWRQIQKSLKTRGFSPGPADGIYGPTTQAAIKNFQEKMGASPTGHLTSEQIDLLLRAKSTGNR